MAGIELYGGKHKTTQKTPGQHDFRHGWGAELDSLLKQHGVDVYRNGMDFNENFRTKRGCGQTAAMHRTTDGGRAGTQIPVEPSADFKTHIVEKYRLYQGFKRKKQNSV